MSSRGHHFHSHTRHALAVHICTLAAFACFSPLTTQAAPEPEPEQVSATVKLADLDLSKPEGMQAARARLKVAAQRLCSKVSDSRSVTARTAHQECSGETLEAALLRLNSLVRVAKN